MQPPHIGGLSLGNELLEDVALARRPPEIPAHGGRPTVQLTLVVTEGTRCLVPTLVSVVALALIPRVAIVTLGSLAAAGLVIHHVFDPVVVHFVVIAVPVHMCLSQRPTVRSAAGARAQDRKSTDV